MVIDASFLQFLNVPLLIDVIAKLLKPVMVVRFSQPLNAFAPIDVTPDGIDIDVTAVFPLNAFEPIDVTVFGIETDDELPK